MKKLTLIGIVLLTVVSCSPGEDVIIAEGSLEATEVIVSAEVTGRIVAFDVQEGTLVDENRIIVKIDDQQLVLQRGQLVAMQKRIESQRPHIEIQLAPLEEQLATARADQMRITTLSVSQAASQKQKEDADARVKTLELQLAAQKCTLEQTVEGLNNEVESLSYQIAQLDDRIDTCIVHSPIDGILLTRYVDSGELAVAGHPLFKVADLNNIFLRAYITASQLSTIRLNDTVNVKVDHGESDSRYYKGTVSWISEEAEFTPKTVQTRDERASLVYAVKVSLENDGYLKLGMYGAIIEVE